MPSLFFYSGPLLFTLLGAVLFVSSHLPVRTKKGPMTATRANRLSATSLLGFGLMVLGCLCLVSVFNVSEAVAGRLSPISGEMLTYASWGAIALIVIGVFWLVKLAGAHNTFSNAPERREAPLSVGEWSE